jgi:hypothetical protein
VAAVAVAAGEVAVAVVVAAEAVVDGLVATATPFATAAGKPNDTFDDTTPGDGFPLGSAFDVDHFSFPRHLLLSTTAEQMLRLVEAH